MRQGYPLDASSPSFRSVPILMNRYLFQTGARRFVCCFSLPIRADRLQPRCHSACSSSSAPDGRYEESWRRAKRLIGTDTVLSSAEQTRFCEWLEMNNKRTWVFLGFRRRKKKKRERRLPSCAWILWGFGFLLFLQTCKCDSDEDSVRGLLGSVIRESPENQWESVRAGAGTRTGTGNMLLA